MGWVCLVDDIQTIKKEIIEQWVVEKWRRKKQRNKTNKKEQIKTTHTQHKQHIITSTGSRAINNHQSIFRY
jgi:hypothetical protein